MHYEKFADGTVKCIEDEIPFDIPDSWAWTRLGVIFSHNTGKALNVTNNIGTLKKYITTSNVYWNQFVLDTVKEMYFTDDELEKCTIVYGDLLVCEGGDIGRAAIWNKDYSIFIQNHLHRLRPILTVCVKFYYYIFYLYKQNDMINGNGIGLQGLSSNRLHSLLVPLSSYKEQNRIVEKIQTYCDMVETIEAEQAYISSLVQSAKSRILDLAIHGKLVPQDPNEEPASALLERIKAEKEESIKQGKIKREKTESAIFKGEDNSYYDDIPDNWEACSILQIAEVELGKTLDAEKNKGDYHPYLRSVNIRWNGIDLNGIKEMRFEKDELERYSIKRGDLLICEGGDVGRCCVWNLDNQIFYQNALHRVRFYGNCNPQYFAYILIYLESIGYLKRISNGVTIKHLTKNVLSSIPFLLPPLAEQNRIVEAIERYFAYLDNIAQALA